MKRISFILLLGVPLYLFGQRPLPIFSDRKIINSHSTETLLQRQLDFRVAHRFGDLLGDDGGWSSFYGLETARDILIGFDYGVTDYLMLGVNRTKGSGPLRMLINGYFKYKLAGQRDDGDRPLAVTFLGMGTISTMPQSDDISAINNFPKFAHRMSYHAQLMVGKRFSDRLSMQFNTAYTHRNFVALNDVNYVLSLGLAARQRISKRLAILLDLNYPMRFRDVDFDATVPIGVGLEWMTGGGHVFQINFTNAGGLTETDYLSNTQSRWEDGQFRLGFTISRQFKI